jgi:chorismate mutase
VPNVVDLSLCAEARRSLHRVLSERGLGFFVKTSSGRAPHLDSRRIAWIVEAARRQARARHEDPDALSRTRRVVRRELIRRLAEHMVQAGL